MKSCSIIYRDSNLAVVDKSAGISLKECHESLANYLVMKTSRELPRDFCINPIGSLDRTASGIHLFCLNPSITRELEKCWNTSRAARRFVALVKGDITQTGSIRFPLKNALGDKQNAVTCYAPIQNFGFVSYIKVWAETTCRHQIRRHLSRRYMSIMGDRKFGEKFWNDFFEEEMGLGRMFLHVDNLHLDLKSYNRHLEFSSPIPPELEAVINKLMVKCPLPAIGYN